MRVSSFGLLLIVGLFAYTLSLEGRATTAEGNLARTQKTIQDLTENAGQPIPVSDGMYIVGACTTAVCLLTDSHGTAMKAYQFNGWSGLSPANGEVIIVIDQRISGRYVPAQ